MKRKKDLSLLERQDLYEMRWHEIGIREIGRILDRAASTILRELKRNGPQSRAERRLKPCLMAKLAHERAERRKHSKRPRMRVRDAAVRSYIAEKLQPRKVMLSDGRIQELKGWSLKTICERMPHELGGKRISHEAAYQWILSEARHLLEHLEVLGKYRRRRKRTESVGRGRRPKPGKRCYSERPESVESRKEFGHCERDTIVSARGGRGALMNISERSSRLIFAGKMDDLTAESGRRATVGLLCNLPAGLLRSITNDNGPENEDALAIERVLGVEVYFCDPYAPQQRGTVERLNRSLRRIFPKGTNFDEVTDEQIKLAADWHNNKPMAVLKYQTPAEVFASELKKFQLKRANDSP